MNSDAPHSANEHVATRCDATTYEQVTFEREPALFVSPNNSLVSNLPSAAPDTQLEKDAGATPRAALQPGSGFSVDPTSVQSHQSQSSSQPVTPRGKRVCRYPLFSPCLNYRMDPSSEDEDSDTRSLPNTFKDLGKGIWSWFCDEEASPDAWLQSAPSVDSSPGLS